METRESLIASLNVMRREKLSGWKRAARIVLNELAELDDPFARHEWHGTESLNRKQHRADCPSFDKDE